MKSLLDYALDYHRRGWCIIPMRLDTKLPARKWKAYRTKHPTKAMLRPWFGNGHDFGLGVIFGSVSGNLGSRDFDTMVGYERWAAEHPDLAATLPTVETIRGRHVYFCTSPDNVAKLHRAIGKPDGTGAIACDDGEVWIGEGCYSVLPPSTNKRWLAPLSDDLPLVDLFTSGFILCNREDRGLLREPKENSAIYPCLQSSPMAMSSAASLLHEATDPIELAILRTMPTQYGSRHRSIFELARELKTLPGLADLSLEELKPIVRRWHKLALPYIQTKAFEETWFDFCEGWHKVKYPKGQEPIAMLFAQAIATDPPEVALQYEQAELRSLVALCRELQRGCGDGPFFLAVRTAAGLVGRDPGTASRWLRGLCLAKVLCEVEKGELAKHRASRYRYLHPI